MPNAREIEAILLDENSGLRESITRDVGASTVALFAIVNPNALRPLAFSGTGSLVRIAKSHYILTAAHVWEECLKASRQVGITMIEGVDHCYAIDTAALKAFGLLRPSKWNEWGPDLVFLEVPHENVGEIELYRKFYPLDSALPNQKVDGIEVLILLGTPGEFGKYSPTHAELNINGFFSDVNARTYKHGDFDYVDLREQANFPGIPKFWGGVSGGGLWRVQIFGSPEKAEIKRQWTLEGVAFFQINLPDSHVIIRCHGIDSVRAAMNAVPRG